MAIKSAAAEPEESGVSPSEGMGGLAKGLAVIEAFATLAKITVSEAAAAAAISRPAARRCLLTLLDLGYVSHDGKYFHPMPRMLRLGNAYLRGNSLVQAAQPLLAVARDKLQESVSLAILDGAWSVFVARSEAQRIVSTGAKLGGRLPAFCSATGRVLLSGQNEKAIGLALATVPFEKYTSKTLTAHKAVIREINAAASNGYAVSDEEMELGMRSIAVQVTNPQGEVVAAISASASSARVSLDNMVKRFLPVLKDIAHSLERSL